MKVRFWGTRGSIPSPLKPKEVEAKIRQAIQAVFGMPDIDTNDVEAVLARVGELPPGLRGTAGGNSACVEIQTEGKTFIIDAGSGLRELGLELMKGPCGRGQGILHLFISHPHWDHIQGFPMFTPAYVPGNRIFIYGVHDLKTAFEIQQRPSTWPLALSSDWFCPDRGHSAYMRAKIEFISLQVGQRLSVGNVHINTIQNAHPGDSYSYRFETPHSVLVYASDAEYKQLDDASVQSHIAFFRNADVLIFDAQYTLKESWQKVDWGHSSAMIGLDLARAAGVKKLLLFHYDPTNSDAELQEIQSTAMAYQAQDTTFPTCEVVAAYEGLTLDLTPPGTVALALTPDGEAAVLTPISAFDERGVDQLVKQLTRLAERDAPTSPIIDLSQVETLTTASLRLLVGLRPKDKSSLIVLAAPSESIRQVIDLAGYLDYFAIYPSVDAALAAVQVREALNLPGEVIKDRYQIEHKVGESRLGTVLRATDTHTDRTVVLKTLSPTFSEETITQFMRQAQQVMALDHYNIVKIIAWDKDEGYSFLVEEYVAGPTLHDLLADGDTSLSADQAMDIALDIARALEYAHGRGVIHADLKSQNVFLTDDGAKLSGFGLGRLEEGHNLLEAPVLFLTASCLAPEQILGQALDARTDLYALGVMLYQLFTGRLPFEGSDREVMQAHLHQAPLRPRELNPHISPALEHLILKLLAKNPNDRYASAQQVRRVLSGLVAGAEEMTGPRRGPLVGREKQLQALQACWEEACTGQGQLAFITGERGIGKTSLLQQAAVQSEPPVLLIGRCQEQERSPAYHLFTQVLRAYFVTVPPELMDEKARQLLGSFTRLVPEIRQMLPDLPEPPPLEPKEEQLRLMTSLTQFINRATQERPWLLILDDLQWITQSSLELLRYLSRHLPSMALLVIGAYNDVELQRGHPLLEALRDLSSHSTYHHFPLDRLTQVDVGQVLANIWQQPVPTALTKRIYQHTEGNPCYVEEVAQGLIDDGLVTLQEGRWHFPALEEVHLPGSVHEVVWRRIGHLNRDTQTLLRQAAVLGRTFKFDDLREMSGLSDEWEVLEHLDAALERGLVQEVPGDTMLRFRHGEIQAVLYADLGSLRRRMLHRQAGEVLERRAWPEPERIAGELAHHFSKAGELERALVYSIQAARQAQDAYANEAALSWYERTLEMLDRLGPEEALQFQSLRLSIHESLGEVLALVGRYDEALEHYASARSLVEAEVSSTEEARQRSAERSRRSLADLYRQMAEVREKRSEYDLAFEWLGKGLSYLGQDEAGIETARIYLVGAGVHRRQGRNEEAITWCQRSLNIASQIKTRQGQQVIARAYSLLGGIYARRGDLPQAVQLCCQSVQAYEQIGDPVGQANAYNNLAIAYFRQGDWAQASDAHRKSLTIRQEIGDVYGQGLSTHNLAFIDLHRGEWSQAASLFKQSLRIWEQVGALWGEANTLIDLARVQIYQENWAEARVCLSRSQALCAEIGSEELLSDLERGWGEFYLKTGELDGALDHTRRSIELAVGQDDPLEEGKSRRMLGRVHLARSEPELAEEALRSSLQILGDLNSEYEAAKTKLSFARLRMETGLMDEARAHLTQILEIFEKLGAQADLAEARDLEQQLYE